jgi:hypothetical protein
MKAFDQDPWVAVTVNPFSEKAVVTSLGSEDAAPQRLYEKVYCVRGDMEKPHQRMSARSVRRPYLGGNDARQPAASVVRLDGYVLLCAGRAAIPQHSGRRFRDVSGFGGRSRLWEVVGARFVADSPLEGDGFELLVPRYDERSILEISSRSRGRLRPGFSPDTLQDDRVPSTGETHLHGRCPNRECGRICRRSMNRSRRPWARPQVSRRILRK